VREIKVSKRDLFITAENYTFTYIFFLSIHQQIAHIKIITEMAYNNEPIFGSPGI
jgi:hypothetical protein